MRTENVHTLILGAGPSGLAAGYTLAKAGLKPIVLERDTVPGGLMRSVHHGDFVIDIGRKELYNRLAKVDAFWSELLGRDYREYAHRGGILYNGRLIDMSPAFQGVRRGMPWGMFVSCAVNLLWNRANPLAPKPTNVQDYFYQKRGRYMTQIFSQGFQEKLTGKRWAQIPVAENQANGDAGFFTTMTELAKRALSKKEVNTFKGIWRHPARGTGQICDAMADGITKNGGTIHYGSRITAMSTAQGRVDSVTAEVAGESVEFRPAHVATSIPVDFLIKYLLPESSHSTARSQQASPDSRRTVILVYLFLNEEPRFPHAWLQVTCPRTRIGRITNYTAFNGDMVPKGKTCLCCEYYCFGPDALLDMDPKQLVQQTLEDCARYGLATPAACFDHIVLKLPGADASQNRDNWMSKRRLEMLAELKQFQNLYYINRTETDIATLAGIEAGEAIISGHRTDFDQRIDPAVLGIRSESKAFEFKLPVAVEQ